MIMSYYYLFKHYIYIYKTNHQGKGKSEFVPGHTASNLNIFTPKLGLKMGILYAKLQKQDYKTWVQNKMIFSLSHMDFI